MKDEVLESRLCLMGVSTADKVYEYNDDDESMSRCLMSHTAGPKARKAETIDAKKADACCEVGIVMYT